MARSLLLGLALVAGLAAGTSSVPLRVIKASSSLPTARFAVDGSARTSWYGSNKCGTDAGCKNQWLRFDAGSACRITRIGLLSGPSTAVPRHGSLYGWNGKAWIKLAAFTNTEKANQCTCKCIDARSALTLVAVEAVAR